uniref:thromboxane A2 receptor-like n=1 Tax=Myxine glutinosa TaxID=7769 RepID=UPI0035900BD9
MKSIDRDRGRERKRKCERWNVPSYYLLAGVVSNAGALVALRKASRRTGFGPGCSAFQLILTGLIGTDLLGLLATGAVVIPIHFLDVKWRTADPNQHLCNTFGVAMVFFGLSSLLLSCVLALERLSGVTRPLAHIMAPRRACWAILAAWGVAFSASIAPLVGIGSYEVQWPGSWCFLATGPLFSQTLDIRNTSLIVAVVDSSCTSVSAQPLKADGYNLGIQVLPKPATKMRPTPDEMIQTRPTLGFAVLEKTLKLRSKTVIPHKDSMNFTLKTRLHALKRLGHQQRPEGTPTTFVSSGEVGHTNEGSKGRLKHTNDTRGRMGPRGPGWGALAFSVLGLCSLGVSLTSNVVTSVCLARRGGTWSGKQRWCNSGHEVEMLVQLLGIMFAATVCWCPLLVILEWIVLSQPSLHCQRLLLSIRLATWNQILDPWVYILCRRSVLRRLCPKLAAAVISPQGSVTNRLCMCDMEQRPGSRKYWEGILSRSGSHTPSISPSLSPTITLHQQGLH